MKALLCLMAFCSVAFAEPAGAYEYRLQFTPNSGYRDLVVAGYAFDGDTVVGNCSYYTVHSGSGRGGGYKSIKTYFNQTCTWELYGNLLSVTPGAPVPPAPQYISGTQTVYAVNANGAYTGSDTALLPFHGFVNTPGSHYSWTTSNAYAVLQQALYTFTATLLSDGDVPLQISALAASALHGGAVVDSTTCIGSVPVGTTCTVTVSYDPTQLRSPSGLAYDTLDINVTSDSEHAYDFIQSYTIVLTSMGDDNDPGSCGDACDGGPCTGFLLRSGTCQPSDGQCICVPNTPAPGECALACDGRPCVGHCSDGTMASGFCTDLTIDTGCACALLCAGPTSTPAPPVPTPTPTAVLGACAAACDNRPCEGQCPDGSLADGMCSSLTIDRGCACTLSCGGVSLCPGDCNGDGQVTVSELVLGVNLALGVLPLAECPAIDATGEGRATVTDLVAAVAAALAGACPG